MTVRYFHGGPIGVQRGAFLLPPVITRARSLADYGADGVCRRDRVYITTNETAALIYAAGVKRGVIYEVSPIGEIEPDPDCSLPGLSYQCEKAKVIRVRKVSPKHIAMARQALVEG